MARLVWDIDSRVDSSSSTSSMVGSAVAFAVAVVGFMEVEEEDDDTLGGSTFDCFVNLSLDEGGNHSSL